METCMLLCFYVYVYTHYMETYMFFCKRVHKSTITCMFPCITPVSAHFDPHWKRVHCVITDKCCITKCGNYFCLEIKIRKCGMDTSLALDFFFFYSNACSCVVPEAGLIFIDFGLWLEGSRHFLLQCSRVTLFAPVMLLQGASPFWLGTKSNSLGDEA